MDKATIAHLPSPDNSPFLASLFLISPFAPIDAPGHKFIHHLEVVQFFYTFDRHDAQKYKYI